jgi:dolichol-phosphate mannosyltransferase
MKKIFVILPCYNEEENIEDLINEWVSHRELLNKKGYDLEVIAIDDCSKDKTKQKIINMTKKHNCLLLEAHEKNKGL